MLILEDDAQFREGFDSLLEIALSELPGDWDALWLGGTSDLTEPYSDSLKRLKGGTGGYCCLIKETMYDAIIQLQQKEMYYADIAYKKLHPQFNCFRTIEHLILHPAGMSTIQKRYVDYPELRK